MFLKLSAENLKKKANLKNNLVHRLKERAAAAMPQFPQIESAIIQKKAVIVVHSLPEHRTIYTINDKPILAGLSDGTIIPHLSIAMAYPGLLKCVYVDEGAVRPLVRGADLMAPGVKEFGAEFGEGEVIEVRLLGTTVPFAIGVATVSSEGIKSNPKGPAVQLAHVLKDALWDRRLAM